MYSEITPGEMLPNVGAMLARNSSKFKGCEVFAEKQNGTYNYLLWDELYEMVINTSFHLKQAGMLPGEKVVLFSRNSVRMLVAELAIMAGGGVAVPIFANFKKDTAELLIKHSDAAWLMVGGDQQLSELSPDLPLRGIWNFSDTPFEGFKDLRPFSELLAPRSDKKHKLLVNAASTDICLNMYTSGTMGIPKCVQLTHENILSQQAALSKVLPISQRDRFLSYLPWHHSFGGIFELFSALCNGATMAIESSFGRDTEEIFENWKLVKPTVFFSVPKIYQSLFDLTRESKQAEKTFFDSGLRFIFTAAAALPQKLSEEFERRKIPVIEGWGLTETSPCCTLTDPTLHRENGVVGKPIPGVRLRIAEDDEIQVKGPNVMVGYYNNEEANSTAFTKDGWYRTGDVGALTDKGLKLISRKDRIFKLSNGEKVIPTDLEKAIELKCHYVQYAVVSGSGEEHPVALIFPNRKLLEKPDYELSAGEGCFCPRSINELGKCLTGCLAIANNSIGQKFAKVKSAAIIMDELSLDTNTLTPSMKVAPKNVVDRYKKHLQNLYGDKVPVDEEVYIIHLDPKKKKVHV
jgi:long-subunit acyl-CoA synthetase (AMP-forming)